MKDNSVFRRLARVAQMDQECQDSVTLVEISGCKRVLIERHWRRVVGGRSVGRGAACARGRGAARGGRPRASASPPSRDPPRGLPRARVRAGPPRRDLRSDVATR